MTSLRVLYYTNQLANDAIIMANKISPKIVTMLSIGGGGGVEIETVTPAWIRTR